MVDQMLKTDDAYVHPEYSEEIVTLGDGSRTLCEMMHNVVLANRDRDFLGVINPETKTVSYQSFGTAYAQMHAVKAFLQSIVKKLDTQTPTKQQESSDSQNSCETIDIGKHSSKTNSVDQKADVSNNSVSVITDEFYVFNNKTIKYKELIGIYSVNRPEWLVSEYAIYFANCTNCPLYSTFGPESIKHILTETEMKICFVSGIKAKSLLQDVLSAFKSSLRFIISFDSLENDVETAYKKLGIEVYYLSDILAKYSTNSYVVPGEADSDSSNSDKPRNRFTQGPKNASEALKTSNNSNKTAKNHIKDDNSSESDDQINMALDFSFVDGDDAATICYTSGTSGAPKGVILTHTNFISTAAGFLRCKGTNGQFKIAAGDTYVSYLPLAHVMERVCVLVFTCSAARIAFFRGNPKVLQEDMKIAKPTFLVGVPRVFNVFKERISEEVQKKGKVAFFIFKQCVNFKIFFQRFGMYKCFPIDKLIFRRVSKEFGGELRAGMNGSAPLSADVTEFLQAVFSMRIVQGYGQTEATAANILCTLGDYTNDRVGIPFPTNAVKLIPTSDSYSGTVNNPGFFCRLRKLFSGNLCTRRSKNKISGSQNEFPDVDRSDENINISGENNNCMQNNDSNANEEILRGEICLKGRNITPGYFKRPDLTNEVFSADGWLKTGDIGEICNKKGLKAFKIVGRRKEIFKTSLGEYIIPEKIENVLKCDIIEDILITGDSKGDFIVAIVVCKNPKRSKEEVEKYLIQKSTKLAAQNILTRFEIPRKIILLRSDFDTFGEMLTPTMKKKRSKIEAYFRREIQQLYNK